MPRRPVRHAANLHLRAAVVIQRIVTDLRAIRLVRASKPKAAAELFSKSLLIREKVLGQEHPFTVATKAELDRCARVQPRVPAGAMSAAGGAGTGVTAGVITAATADGQEAAAGMDAVQMDAAMSDAVHDPVDVD